MKLTIVILFLGLMQVSASVYSQATKFSFDLNNRQIIDVLKEIEESSEFRFFFQDEQVDVSRRVSVNVENGTIDELLQEMFAKQNISYKIFNDKMILLTADQAKEATRIQQQRITVTGKVTDEAGQSMPGVTVVIDGTQTGTITDVNGNYTLTNVDSNAILSFSFVGMKSQQVPVAGKTNISVTLESAFEEVDEVVIVGYGTQKMKNVTGAVSTVNPQEITDLPVGNLGAALQGTVTGLNVSGGQTRPGVAATLTIRSPFTLSKDGGTTSPIYVIDDFVADETAFNNLDPNEIESISVLKDAAAAIYGARSSQGAVLVKTKRGKEGAPRISVSSQFTFNDETSRAKMLSAYDYGVFYNRYMGPSGKNKTSNPTYDFFQADELETMRDLNYDWLEDAWTSSGSMKHNVNLSGGSKNATYFAGISYFTQDGNLSSLDYERWNYRAGADIKVSSNLKVALQVSGDYGEKKQTFNKIGGEVDENDYSTLLTTPYYVPAYVNVYDENGMPTGEQLPTMRYGPLNNRTDNDIIRYNFFEIERLGDTKHNKPTNMRLNTTVEYDFGWSKALKGLKLKMAYSKGISTNLYNQNGSQYTAYYFTERSGSGRHLYEGDIAGSAKTYTVKNGNRLLRDGVRSDSYQLNLYAIYERSFGKHNISALYSWEKSEAETETVRYYKDDVLSFTNGQSNTATGSPDGQTTRTESGLMSYIGRFNYSYADKYLFEFLIRSDASTKFAPVNYWGTFPSFSAGWVISEENFFEGVSWIDFLKIRGSIGFLGKDNTKAWLWRQRYTYQNNKGAVFGTSTSSNIGWGLKMEAAPNYNATWDKSTKYNLGIDSKYLDNKLSFSIDGYFDRNTEMLTQRDALVPVTVGGNLAAENYDAIDAYGIEISVGWKDKIGSDASYFVKLNTGWSDTRYRKKDWPAIIGYNDQYPDGPVDRGKWGYDCLGMFRTQADIDAYVADYNITSVFNNNVDNLKPGMLYYRDVRGEQNEDGSYAGPDGIIDDKDMIQLSKKSGNPYGFSLNFGGNWKGLSLTAQIAASWGGFSELPGTAKYVNEKRADYTNVPVFWNDMFSLPVLDADGAEIPGTGNVDGKYPNMYQSTFNSVTSNFWQIDSFNMHLRNVTLGYNLPKSLLNKLNIDGCRFSLTGMNLISFHNPYPEKFMDTFSNYGAYPTLRSVTLGVNLSF
ncbi:TonB-dependent receptor [Gaoshiqia sediminis]|uniref:TonB-dependent receptor n=1 Tax=Gaoshiqia sediminis TaxID=2986998 RepID=A0AA42C5R0_9BACT|nr:TonB-dependent receptor [Gaoshiqia sediminis]MCW0481804.1 TonB-dependent receptor [Gaoshiqia sediminis]